MNERAIHIEEGQAGYYLFSGGEPIAVYSTLAEAVTEMRALLARQKERKATTGRREQ